MTSKTTSIVVPITRDACFGLASRLMDQLAGYRLIEKSPRDRIFQLKYKRDAPRKTWLGETRVTVELILDMSIRAKNADDLNATVTVKASCHGSEGEMFLDEAIQGVLLPLERVARLEQDKLRRAQTSRKAAEELRTKIQNDPKNGDLYLDLALRLFAQLLPEVEDESSGFWDEVRIWSPYTLLIKEAKESLNLSLALGLSNPLRSAKARFLLIAAESTTSEPMVPSTEAELASVVSGGHVGRILFQALPHVKTLTRDMIADAKKHLRRFPHSVFSLRLQRAGHALMGDREAVGRVEQALNEVRGLLDAGLVPEVGGEEQPAGAARMNDGLEFEQRAQRLLLAMGLSAQTTKASGDGGIDIVAYSEDPVFAGKYIVQCKDWASPVGEPVVRDLYGVVMSEGANKGILIATGGFTSGAERFAMGKPLELIDGSGFRKLMEKYRLS